MDKSRTTLQKGDEFRDSACGLLRLADFTVSVEVRVGHKKLDATAEKFEYGRLKRYGIECKAFNVSKPLSIKIVADYIGLKGPFVDELWVIAISFSPDARRHIDGIDGFRAISIRELEDIADKIQKSSSRQIVATPDIIRGMFEILDHLKRGETTADLGAEDVIGKLQHVRLALEGFAADGLRLTAFTRLQAVTNHMQTDLHETFAILSTDLAATRIAHSAHLDEIAMELRAVWLHKRAGAELAALRDSRDLMQHLLTMPTHVREFISESRWDEFLLLHLQQAQLNVANFELFNLHIRKVRTATIALNHYSLQMISVGVEQLTATMGELRRALAEK